MIAYILKVTLCWVFFYGIYELFLKKRTFFTANRTYLMVTLVLGALLPLMEFIPWKNDSGVAYVIYPVLFEIDGLQQVAMEQSAKSINWILVLTFIYASGFIISLTRLMLGIKKILDLYHGSEKVKQNGYLLVLTNHPHLPFSFFKWVFLSQKLDLSEELEQVIDHEVEHIRGLHSMDILITEFLKVAFWCSPLIYFYKNALKEVHEYLADHIVVNKTNKISYKKLLLKQTNNGLQLALTHQFFNSHLKNRLKMINQKRSGRPTLVMYALGIPVLLLLTLAFTAGLDFDKNSGETINEQPLSFPLQVEANEYVTVVGSMNMESDNFSKSVVMGDTIPGKANTVNGDELFRVVEQMPRFPGCEEESDDLMNKCSTEKLLSYVYNNLKYPKQAKEEGIEGTVVVQFVVTKEGSITDFVFVRDIGGGTKEEVLRVLESMNNLSEKWTPGMQRGRKVNVQMSLPIAFKLAKSDAEKNTNPAITSNSNAENQEIFKVVEEMPRFPGCEDMDMNLQQKENCAKQKMLEYIYNNVKYPASAKEKGIQGVSVIQFVIEKDGSITGAKIVRDPGEGCGEAALMAIESMNNMDQKWIPGKQRGQKVNVQYTIPIMFKLADKEEEVKKQNVPPANENNVGESLKNDEGLGLGSEVYYVLNDEEYEGNLDEINPEHIKRIEVLKDEAAVKAYGEKGKNGVVKIFTKDYKEAKIQIRPGGEDKPLYVIDGKIKKDTDLETIDPGQIGAVNVLKGEKAITAYGERGKNGVIEISLKNQPKEKELKVKDFKAFPNPNSGVVNLSFRAEAVPTTIQILDVTGKVIETRQLDDFNGSYDDRIELKNDQLQMVILRIIQKDKVYSSRIVME